MAWLPYRDFLLLHPPGIVLALLPFAELGRLIGDGYGLALAEVAWMALGAVNAVLVTRILRDRGLVPAAIGGLGYAVFFPAAYLDHYTSLETPATTCLLLGVLLLVRTSPASRIGPRTALAVGALVGAGAAFKIWGVVPAGAVLLWCMATSGWRRALVATSGVGLGAAAICLPFFALPRARCGGWSYWIRSAGRPRTTASRSACATSSVSPHSAFASAGSRSSWVSPR